MTIEAALSREQFIRLSILRHIQRKNFYFYAAVCAALTGYALLRGPNLLLFAAWVPFILYLVPGILGAYRESANKDNPLFLPTRYEFNQRGVSISSSQGDSQLTWDYFAGWKIMAECYVLVLKAGPMLAIPQATLSSTQVPQFETLLQKYIEPR